LVLEYESPITTVVAAPRRTSSTGDCDKRSGEHHQTRANTELWSSDLIRSFVAVYEALMSSHHRACALSRHIQSSLQGEESWERCRNTWSGFWWEENSAEIERKQRGIRVCAYVGVSKYAPRVSTWASRSSRTLDLQHHHHNNNKNFLLWNFLGMHKSNRAE
jgi:hypothetical protein